MNTPNYRSGDKPCTYCMYCTYWRRFIEHCRFDRYNNDKRRTCNNFARRKQLDHPVVRFRVVALFLSPIVATLAVIVSIPCIFLYTTVRWSTWEIQPDET